MKTISLIPTEFISFQEIARRYNISFSSLVQNGLVIVEAKADELEIIGY